MTKAKEHEVKKAAAEAMKENGYKVFMSKMILLECGWKSDTLDMTEYGLGIEKISYVDYVMFEDRTSGRVWQCSYGSYNDEKDTLWMVEEYK